MNLSTTPNCSFCPLNVSGTFLHMMWECPKVQYFWVQVVKFLSDKFQLNIPCCPKYMLLNDNDTLLLNTVQRRVWLAGSTAAKKMLTLRWQSPHTLPFNQWKQSLLDIVTLELSTARMNGANLQTIESWHDKVKSSIS